MVQAGRDESAFDVRMQLGARDKIVICLVIFFSAIALTFELYWLIFNQAMENRTDLLARAFALYWPADPTYRIPGFSPSPSRSRSKASTLSSRRAFRLCSSGLFSRVGHSVMQLTIPTYTLYSVLLYYLVAHISGYAVFENKDATTFLLFYLVNAPWFVGYAWMACDAFQALTRPHRLP